MDMFISCLPSKATIDIGFGRDVMSFLYKTRRSKEVKQKGFSSKSLRGRLGTIFEAVVHSYYASESAPTHTYCIMLLFIQGREKNGKK